MLTAAIAQRFLAVQVGQQLEDAEEVLEATEEQVLAEIRELRSRLQVLKRLSNASPAVAAST